MIDDPDKEPKIAGNFEIALARLGSASGVNYRVIRGYFGRRILRALMVEIKRGEITKEGVVLASAFFGNYERLLVDPVFNGRSKHFLVMCVVRDEIVRFDLSRK